MGLCDKPEKPVANPDLQIRRGGGGVSKNFLGASGLSLGEAAPLQTSCTLLGLECHCSMHDAFLDLCF